MIQEYEMYYKDEEGKRILDVQKFQVLITTFEVILSDNQELSTLSWKACVIDEAHRLKNRNCKLIEGLRVLKFDHIVLLSGTPLQNSVEELYSLLNFLEPDRFHSPEEFLRDFGDLKTEAQVDKLKAVLKPMMLRRLKEDVEKSLAPKEETIIEVELTNVQKKYYRAILEKNFSFLYKGTQSVPSLMNTMMELRKCCIHPYLIAGAEEQILAEARQSGAPDYAVQALIQASGKLVLCDKLLPRLKEGGHRVLIFSQMVRCLDILEDYLINRKYPYERLDGRVRGNLRQAAIDRFCKPDSDRFVFLLCTRAGGLGINLTAADTCIIFDSDWNPQNDLQAQARCHRIGQRKMVKIYRLICRNTYEREMFDKAGLKLGLDKAVLQSIQKEGGGGGGGQMSKQEIEELLKKGAYGAIMDDDNAGDKFCEEDIDQILSRRATTITIESEGKGSTFSKASFAVSSSREDIDVDDPNFWEKWAKKANLDVETLNKGEQEMLILQEPRRRTQVKRFGANEPVTGELGDMDSDEDGDTGGRNRKGGRGKRGHAGDAEDDEFLVEISPGNWTRSECSNVEKGMLTFGWQRWNECIAYSAWRRPVNPTQVEHMARVILLFCLQCYKGDDKIKAFIWDLIEPPNVNPPAPGGESKRGRPASRRMRNHSGLSGPVPRGKKAKRGLNGLDAEDSKDADEESDRLREWARTEEFDTEILLSDEVYRKHLHRHANKVLLRIRMLYYLQHHILGETLSQRVLTASGENPLKSEEIDTIMPTPPNPDGDPPAPWWTEVCDKHLLVGVFKHGYERYAQVRQDPELIFHKICADSGTERNNNIKASVDEIEEDTQEGSNSQEGSEDLKDKKDAKEDKNKKEANEDKGNKKEANETNEDNPKEKASEGNGEKDKETNGDKEKKEANEEKNEKEANEDKDNNEAKKNGDKKKADEDKEKDETEDKDKAQTKEDKNEVEINDEEEKDKDKLQEDKQDICQTAEDAEKTEKGKDRLNNEEEDVEKSSEDTIEGETANEHIKKKGDGEKDTNEGKEADKETKKKNGEEDKDDGNDKDNKDVDKEDVEMKEAKKEPEEENNDVVKEEKKEPEEVKQEKMEHEDAKIEDKTEKPEEIKKVKPEPKSKKGKEKKGKKRKIEEDDLSIAKNDEQKSKGAEDADLSNPTKEVSLLIQTRNLIATRNKY